MKPIRPNLKAGNTLQFGTTNIFFKLIFLPFVDWWACFIMVTTLLNLSVNFTNFWFQFEEQKLTYFYYFCEVFYIIHIVALTSHRYMPKQRRTRIEQPAHALLLLLGIVSIIPYYEVLYLLHLHTWDVYKPTDYYRIKTVLRLGTIAEFFHNKSNSVSIRHVVMLVGRQIVRLILISSVLCCIWYKLACYRCEYPNWSDVINTDHINVNNTLHWWCISYHISSSILAHNWPGIILGSFESEWIFVLSCMLFGFVLHLMIFFGELTGALSRIHSHQFNFTSRLKKTLDLLEDWEVDQKIRKRIIEYFNFFWERRRGEKDMPEAFLWLPMPLRKTVTLDIFWDALRHSHLFTGTDISFKRSVTMMMKSEFMLPGDYIYHTGEMKSKMYYIVSGVVQVLSSEDNESPYLSFSAGTLLGEFNVFKPMNCSASVKCATYCEFHSLSTISLVKVLRENRSTARFLRQKVNLRIAIAKKLHLKNLKLSGNQENDVSMKRFKNQWRAVYALHENKKQEKEEILWQKLDKTFYCAYLDCVVMSQEVELKLKAICLTSQCPLIMEPQSGFRYFCDWLVLLSVCIQFIIIPKYAFFNCEITTTQFVHLTILDMVYYFDIYLQLTTAINYQSKIISKFGDIFFHRIVQLPFVIDVIASLPYPHVFQFVGMGQWELVSRTPRVLKIYKLFVIINDKLNNPWRRNLHLKIVKHILLHTLLIYTFSTMIYASSCFENVCDPVGWYAQAGFPITENFITSIFHVSSIYLGIGISDITSYLLQDIIIETVMIYTGYILFIASIADITASAVLSVRKSYAHQDEIEIMSHIMKQRSIQPDLRKKLMSILNFNWQLNEGTEMQGRYGILNFPEKIKQDTYYDRILKALKSVPLFQAFDDQVVKCCAAHVRISVLPPGTHLISPGILAVTLYVIVRGNCSMMSELPGDRERKRVVILKRGDLLAPLELMHRIKSFVSIQTISAVEILEMPYDKFHDIVRSHPSTYEPLTRALEEHIEKYQNTLYKKRCRLPPMISETPALGAVDSFSYRIYKRKFYIVDEYTRPFIEMKHWSWLRYIMLRSTIDPKGKFFVIWEVFRIFSILLDISIGLFTTSLLEYQIITGYVIVSCFCVIAAIDVYIRLHCQYYNEYGIVVSHPLFTAKHYIQCSFTIDIIQTLPHFILKSTYLFGSKNAIQTQAMLRIGLRSIQIYRFYKSVTYLENFVSWSWGAVIIKVKYSVFLLIALLVMTNILLIATCSFSQISEDVYYMNCSGINWITMSGLKVQLTTNIIFAQAVYVVVTLYGNALSGTFSIGHYSELHLFVFMILVLTVLRFVIFALFTSCTTGGSINLSNYQARMKQFLQFAKEMKLPDFLVKEMVAHNEMVWKQTQGSNIMHVCAKFNNFLRSQFICFLYESTLRLTNLMVNSTEPFLLAVAQKLEEVHFKQGADVIRCNDVQGYMFIVHTGLVDISVAGYKLDCLEKGGVFGCFCATGSERQLISAKANTNITLLAIKSVEFHKLLRFWRNESAEDVIKVILSTRQEYDSSLICGVSPNVFYRRYIRMAKPSVRRYHAFLELFNKKISLTSPIYWYWRYFMDVHVSFLSSVLALFNMSIEYKSVTETIPYALFIISDILYFPNLILGFTLYYPDQDSGVLERVGKNIALRYLKTWFTFDALMCFPFEEIGRLFFSNYTKFMGVNRAFRYYYLIYYYSTCSEKLSIRKHLRWTYLIYKVMFSVQFTTNVWLLLACKGESCWYVTSTNGRPTSFAKSEGFIHSVTVAYTFIINIFSSTGLRAVCPYTISELLIKLVIAFLIQYVIASLASGFATLKMIENNTMMRYQHEIDILKNYLKGRDLSPPIIKLVWEYLLQLWQMQRGEWVPKALYDAPYYLKEDIMKYLYISHIESHFLFENTHTDFLRQLVVHLRRCIYLPGNYIVEAGDLDGSIYFIHKGEVAAYSNTGDDELQCFVLSAKMSFGEAQGLQKIPYQHSYKATTIVEVLILKMESWEYLVRHFPASYETIMIKSIEYGMLFESKYAGRRATVVISEETSDQ